MLPLLSVGATGLIGTSTHFSGAATKQLLEAHERGDAAEALRIYRQLLPIYTGIFRTQGVILVKAGLALQGRPVGPVRLPMVEATEHELSHLRQDLAEAGLERLQAVKSREGRGSVSVRPQLAVERYRCQVAATPGTRTRQPASKKASGPGRARAGGSAPAGRGRTRHLHPHTPARQRPVPAALGRLIAQLWRALGATAGTLARAVGRNAATARELDPAHRRDGEGLAVLALGLISAIAVWFTAAGPLGAVITGLFRLLVGNVALLLPPLLIAWAVHLLRQRPHPERRGRLLVGGLAILLTVTGMLHLGADSPRDETGWSRAGGVTGVLAGQLERVRRPAWSSWCSSCSVPSASSWRQPPR